ncbi:hypothetical protein FOA43_001940 [Brettanomyces nanus]|uniref:1-phosphatidylinositol-3-phosphate 5-kinase n=1 Tax=Eeniella nana TaxID=13502 RepID=A0A875S0W8_EENNA|nr:uncharacterized protein FOA43_001940 [Brettanomyces nanus]QPG74608.1 hypothetical protein FOA43_001940 [Brettanomyces nanus]
MSKHHCRICGKIFCASCTTFIDGSKFNVRDRMRVCSQCAQLADRYEEYATSEEEESVLDDRSSSLRRSITSLSSPATPKPKQRAQFGERSPSLTPETSTTPMPPPLLTIATTRKGEAVEIDIPHSNSISRKGKRPGHQHQHQHLHHQGAPKQGTEANVEGSESSVGALVTTHPSKQADATTNEPSSHFDQLSPLSFTAVAANAASSIFNFTNSSLARNSGPFGTTSASKINSPESTPRLEPPNRTQLNSSARFRGIGINTAAADDDDPFIQLRRQAPDATTLYSSSSEESSDSELGPASFMSGRQLTWSYQPHDAVHQSKLPDSKSVMRRSRRHRASTLQRLRHRRLSRSGRIISGASIGSGLLNNSTVTASGSFGIGAEDFEFLDDFLRAGEKHGKRLLLELLTDKEMDDIDKWTSILIRCLKIIGTVSVEVNNTARFDLSNYLKIKRIPGGSIDDTAVIDGIVFSKSLPLKQMPHEINNPRIMLITFPIEYEQHPNPGPRFSSLEPIIAQQNEYLKKLVARISALRPNIVLTTSTVNGYALRLLSEGGIAVATEMKVQVLERVSRMTKSDVITSIDKLALQPKLGRCGKFETRSYLHEKVIRTYFYFTGCIASLGFSVVLRGSTKEALGKVKECASLMAYVLFNVKLESGLMRDQCLQAPDYEPKGITSALYSIEINSYNDVFELSEKRILSSSPWVSFNAPRLLLDLKNIEDQLAKNGQVFEEFEKKYESVIGDEGLNDASRQSALQKYLDFYQISETVQQLPEGFDDVFKLVGTHHSCQQERLNFDLSTAAKQWDQFWSTRKLGYFDANYHQNIVTLFSMVSSKNATPCIGPEIQLTDFYWENDFSLGQFIEHTCIHANDICTEGCGLTLEEHYRTYVHGSGKVDVILEDNPHPAQDIIMSWSFCKICHNATAVLPLSDNAWKYSFGKYLELSFWCRHTKVKGSSCEHDFYENQIHYFSFRGLAMRIEYSNIDTLGLVPPKFRLFWNPKYDVTIKLLSYKMVHKKSRDFFDSVRGRLNRVKLDSMTTEKVQVGQKRIAELKERVDKEQADIELLCKHIYSTTDVTNHINLNVVIREVQELSSDWNTEFLEFAKQFLPSENDVRTITAFQLDRLFRSVSDEKRDEKDVEGEMQKEEKEKKVDEMGKELDEKREVADPSTRKKSDSILEKKYFWESRSNSVDQDGKSVRAKEPDLPDLEFSSGKVKKLAEFFDAQEYFRQRDLEKRRMDNANRYMPKVITSKPRVEVYKDVNDAVQAEASRSGANKQVSKGFKEAGIEGNSHSAVGSERVKESEEDAQKVEIVQPEKISLLKSLTHFWEDRSASLWEPLTYPLDLSEHIFVDSDVIVREDEPSSIIAFCLSTSDYSSKLCSALGTNREGVEGTKHEEEEDDDDENKEDENKENGEKEIKMTGSHDSVGSLGPPETIEPQVTQQKTAEPSESTERSSKASRSSQSYLTLESIMLKKGFHLKYQFEEGYSTISCKIFFAEQFEAFRRQCGVSSNFLQSLSRCVKWNSTGGKSGSAFLKTLDGRFIIKELSKTELEAFVQFAPSYFEYFAQALFHNLPTVLVKIFGFYQIQVKSMLPGGRSYTIDVLIMENLFYDRKMSRIFDLKGSMRNRHVEQTGRENEVLLDENMVEYIYESPLFVRENAKRLLRASLWNDTLFLAKMNVMDYSLVVGIDSDNKELVVGIIDCIRTFTWDKKLESWVKEKGLVGSSGVGKEPTVITPKQYKNRFREAMESYILMAPGPYYQGTT